jgi:hypothetical protein
MGNSISPIAFRLGFFRAWDSLYTESTQIKNYNRLLKSQIILLYIDGFFRRWTWDGKKSFFMNYLFSHVELSWSFRLLHMYIYVYNSSAEYLFFKLKKNLRGRFRIRKYTNKKVGPFLFNKYRRKYLVNSKISRELFFKPKTLSRVKLFKRVNNMLGYYNNLIESTKEFSFVNKYKKRFILRNKKKKKAKMYSKTIFVVDKKQTRLLESRYYFLKKKVIGSVRFLYNKLHKKQKYGGEYAFSRTFRGREYPYKQRYFFYLNRKNKVAFLMYKFYLFLKGLLKLKYYKTFLIMLNYFFSVNPLERAIRRHFLKDFNRLLGLYKKTNVLNDITLDLVRLLPKSITSAAIGKHLWLKLTKKYHFGFVVQGVLKLVKRARLFKGFLLKCNGRFNKKQKAWHTNYRYGRMPLSEKRAAIDDSIVFIRLRYGVGSIRININYGLK